MCYNYELIERRGQKRTVREKSFSSEDIFKKKSSPNESTAHNQNVMNDNSGGSDLVD